MPRDIASREASSVQQDRLFSKDFVLLCLTNLLFFVVDYSFLVTLPVYVLALGGAVGQAGLLTASSSVVQVIAAPYLGRYVERLGKTTFMSLGMGILLVEGLALPYVSALPLLVVMGALCGVALACFVVGSNTLVTELAPLHRRGQAIGIFGTFTVTSVAISPAVSTFVMQGSGFPTLFAMSAALAAAGLALSRLIREPARQKASEISVQLFSKPALLSGLGIFTITITYGTLVSFLPVSAPRMGLENVGLFFAMFAVASVLVRALAGSVSDRAGRLPVILPGLLVVSAAMFLLGQAQNATLALGLGFIYGLGYSSAHPALLALAVDRAGPGARASAVATFNAAYSLGMATGAIAMGFLLSATSFGIMTAVAAAAPLVAMITLYLRLGRPKVGASHGQGP